ncbi:hypothetical protein J3T99_05150, partial [Acetobacteraceae bacterium B3987]|nr:hypothetical protein [Acetobacteraceae bacterium B3987]
LITGSLSQTLVGIGKGMAANSAGLLGGGRSHDESSESQSAISGNITVNAGHITGSYSRDVAHANGALTNKFDAQKLQNQIQASQLGTQLVGEIVGTAFQKIQDQQMKAQWNRGELSTVPGPFSALEIGRDLLEAGGAAGVAALTGGNVAAAGVGTLSGNVAAAVTRDWTDSMVTSLTGNNTGKLHDSLANLFSGIIAAAGGTVGGLIAGGGDASVDALTGAAAAAAIEQYNADAHKKVWTKKEIDQMREAFLAQDNIPDDQAMILWNSHEQTDAQYAKTVGMPKRAELEKYAREQGVNIEVVMGTIAAESGVDVARGRKVHDGSVQGLGQFANAAFDDSWESLEKRKSPVVSTLIPREKGGKQDPWTTGVLAIETLRNAALQLRKMGIANPTFAEARALYIYGPSGGRDLAKAISRGLNKTMGEVVKNHDHLFNNRTPPDVTVKDFLMHLATGKSGVGRNVINAPILMEGK